MVTFLSYMKPTAFKLHVSNQTVRPSCAVGGYVQYVTKERHFVRAMCSDVTEITFKGKGEGKGKAVPLQAWSGPEGSRRFI